MVEDIADGLETDVALGEELLTRMLRIRRFEDIVKDWFAAGHLRGSTHLYQGQEAVAVGATSCLRPGDTSTCTYRGHGVVLAMGAAVDRAFAEILGRERGLCCGKGGSMHLTDVSVGALGSYAIVGGHLPVTAGAAWAAQLLKTDAVSVCFFGDGAVNIGAFHETMNLASLWRLPAVYIIENNLYGEYSPVASTTANPDLVQRAAAYAMAAARVEGNDVYAVRQTMQTAVDRARHGEGPTLIEAMTYRQLGHSRSDPASYRPAGELESWLERDPIARQRQRLLDIGVQPERIDEIDAATAAEVDLASERALSWPEPPPSALTSDVWSRP